MTSRTTSRSESIGSRCLEQVSGIVEYEVEGDAVLYDPRNDTAHTLNSTASAVWWLCDGSRTVDQVVTDLTRVFQADRRQAEADVKRLVSEFLHAGVIRWV